MALGLNLEPLEAVVDDTDIGEQLEVGNIVEEVLGNETFDKGSEDSNLLVEENVPENQEEMISLDE